MYGITVSLDWKFAPLELSDIAGKRNCENLRKNILVIPDIFFFSLCLEPR